MANEIKLIVGTQILFADHAGDYSPTVVSKIEVATATEYQLSLASLANAAGRESAKADLGSARAEAYSVVAALEFAATPTVGKRVDFYWAPSAVAAAANGNPHNIDGVDAAAPSGYGLLAELLKNLDFIGSFIVTDDATTTVQVAPVGTLYPPERYGILVVVNESGAALHSDDVEMAVALNPILSQYQTA